jgi:hypothetical protein
MLLFCSLFVSAVELPQSIFNHTSLLIGDSYMMLGNANLRAATVTNELLNTDSYSFIQGMPCQAGLTAIGGVLVGTTAVLMLPR